MGPLLGGIKKVDIQRGMVLAKPGTIITPTKYVAILCVLEKESGRHSPFFLGYRPPFYMTTNDVTGKVASLMNNKDEGCKMMVELTMPVACEQGTRFAIREVGNTVGAGVI